MGEVTFKRVYVSSMEDRVTADDVIGLMGLDLTDYLKKNTFVQMFPDENRAEVIVPSDMISDLLKFDKAKMYGQEIGVTIANTDNGSSSTSSSSSRGDGGNNDDTVSYLFLDTRRAEWAKKPISELEVCDALHLASPNDPTKTVKAFWGTMMGCFRIEARDFTSYLNMQVVLRNVELPLVPVRPSTRTEGKEYFDRRAFGGRPTNFDPAGVSVKIFDAWTLETQAIPHEHFDNYFIDMGVEIIKQTQPKKVYGSRHVLSTSRQLVVKIVNADGSRKDLGNQVIVDGKVFKMSYYGMEKWCGLCQKKHGKECPKRVRFEFLKELRRGKTEKMKIHADSTMRYTNQLALTTNVACMSGGGLGQLCNWIKYDDKHPEVIISGGTNEVHSTDPLNEFVYTVEKAELKIRDTASTHEKVMVVLPPIPQDVPELKAKAQYLREKMEAIEVVQTLQLKEVSFEDATHPTAEGTVEVLKQIDEAIGNGVIMDGCLEDVVVSNKYSQVQAVYKVGCRGCDRIEYTARLCTECREKAKEADTKMLDDLIEKYRGEMFPQVENTKKRSHDGDNDSDDGDKSQAKKASV